eukprot:g4424.t1
MCKCGFPKREHSAIKTKTIPRKNKTTTKHPVPSSSLKASAESAPMTKAATKITPPKTKPADAEDTSSKPANVNDASSKPANVNDASSKPSDIDDASSKPIFNLAKELGMRTGGLISGRPKPPPNTPPPDVSKHWSPSVRDEARYAAAKAASDNDGGGRNIPPLPPSPLTSFSSDVPPPPPSPMAHSSDEFERIVLVGSTGGQRRRTSLEDVPPPPPPTRGIPTPITDNDDDEASDRKTDVENAGVSKLRRHSDSSQSSRRRKRGSSSSSSSSPSKVHSSSRRGLYVLAPRPADEETGTVNPSYFWNLAHVFNRQYSVAENIDEKRSVRLLNVVKGWVAARSIHEYLCMMHVATTETKGDRRVLDYISSAWIDEFSDYISEAELMSNLRLCAVAMRDAIHSAAPGENVASAPTVKLLRKKARKHPFSFGTPLLHLTRHLTAGECQESTFLMRKMVMVKSLQNDVAAGCGMTAPQMSESLDFWDLCIGIPSCVMPERNRARLGKASHAASLASMGSFSHGMMNTTSGTSPRWNKADSRDRKQGWTAMERTQKKWIDPMVWAGVSDGSVPKLSVTVCSWNVNGKVMKHQNVEDWLMPPGTGSSDIIAVGLQEMVSLNTLHVAVSDAQAEKNAMKWVKRLEHAMNESEYDLVDHVHLVGVFLGVFAKRSVRRHISRVTKSKVATGLGGTMANKGACGVRFEIYVKAREANVERARPLSLCFVCSHLAAHRKDFEARNRDWKTTNDSMVFHVSKEIEESRRARIETMTQSETCEDLESMDMWNFASALFSEAPFSNGRDARYEYVKAKIRERWGKKSINAGNKAKLKNLAINRGRLNLRSDSVGKLAFAAKVMKTRKDSGEQIDGVTTKGRTFRKANTSNAATALSRAMKRMSTIQETQSSSNRMFSSDDELARSPHANSGVQSTSSSSNTLGGLLKRKDSKSDLKTYNSLLIKSHDVVFWFGDLNYRLAVDSGLDLKDVYKCIDENSQAGLRKLFGHDQLKREREAARVFLGYKEGDVTFKPTYKYLKNTCSYERESEKLRFPAWCDRILWRTSANNSAVVRQTHYGRETIVMSDHMPVNGVFDIAYLTSERYASFVKASIHSSVAAVASSTSSSVTAPPACNRPHRPLGPRRKSSSLLLCPSDSPISKARRARSNSSPTSILQMVIQVASDPTSRFAKWLRLQSVAHKMLQLIDLTFVRSNKLNMRINPMPLLHIAFAGVSYHGVINDGEISKSVVGMRDASSFLRRQNRRMEYATALLELQNSLASIGAACFVIGPLLLATHSMALISSGGHVVVEPRTFEGPVPPPRHTAAWRRAALYDVLKNAREIIGVRRSKGLIDAFADALVFLRRNVDGLIVTLQSYSEDCLDIVRPWLTPNAVLEALACDDETVSEEDARKYFVRMLEEIREEVASNSREGKEVGVFENPMESTRGYVDQRVDLSESFQEEIMQRAKMAPTPLILPLGFEAGPIDTKACSAVGVGSSEKEAAEATDGCVLRMCFFPTRTRTRRPSLRGWTEGLLKQARDVSRAFEENSRRCGGVGMRGMVSHPF